VDVARRIGGRTPVVFVTAYGDHALAAFDAGAVDYLLKPVEAERLAQAVARVQARLVPSRTPPEGAPGLQALLDHLAGQARRAPPLKVLQASVGREVRLIRTDEVIYFESDSRYTRIVFAGGDALIRTPLKELLAQLDEQVFWQVHRSVIVNHQHVAAAVRVDEGHMHLTLRGRSETLPVSRHFQALFKGSRRATQPRKRAGVPPCSPATRPAPGRPWPGWRAQSRSRPAWPGRWALPARPGSAAARRVHRG
jgi:DNA-binding LytR/AlgR family response regulator